jgi:hypothetical protein
MGCNAEVWTMARADDGFFFALSRCLHHFTLPSVAAYSISGFELHFCALHRCLEQLGMRVGPAHLGASSTSGIVFYHGLLPGAFQNEGFCACLRVAWGMFGRRMSTSEVPLESA